MPLAVQHLYRFRRRCLDGIRNRNESSELAIHPDQQDRFAVSPRRIGLGAQVFQGDAGVLEQCTVAGQNAPPVPAAGSK
jgi:hypothetical protein